jgi:glycosyltransferase involved in cell wall biosynthesis
MVILEALAAGLPVVAANVGGVPDLIKEGETGWLCDPHDSSTISAAFQRAWSRPEAAVEMGRRVKAVARARFHPDVIARKHLDVYREVLSRES